MEGTRTSSLPLRFTSSSSWSMGIRTRCQIRPSSLSLRTICCMQRACLDSVSSPTRSRLFETCKECSSSTQELETTLPRMVSVQASVTKLLARSSSMLETSSKPQTHTHAWEGRQMLWPTELEPPSTPTSCTINSPLCKSQRVFASS